MESFLTKDRNFYHTLFGMLAIMALQNLVAYSVNMADNIMLGSYSQTALSGAATVNQIFFMVQQVALGVGNALTILAAQYWGEKRTGPIRRLSGIAMGTALFFGLLLILLCTVFPGPLLHLFTGSEEIVSEGLRYLRLLKWTFALYILTNVLMSALRSVGTVNVSFYISLISLVVNVGINYTLIFGRFGFPEMGIMGAAIGTLIARLLELALTALYIWKLDKKLQLFGAELFVFDRALWNDFVRIGTPVLTAKLLWGISVPMQTAILGHLSDDAIAANSVATTFYQYLKVIVVAMQGASNVMIGHSIGRISKTEGRESEGWKNLRMEARTLCVIDVAIGLVLGTLLFALRGPLLSMYNLSDTATMLALQLILVMSVVMVGMSYQMPVGSGIIQGGGDTRFSLLLNMISTWGIVMPLSFAAAFWWKWPVAAVVLVIQSDQIFKGIPIFFRFRSYKWVKKLTKDD